jgi:hypothetical protein
MIYHLSRMRDVALEYEEAAEFFARTYGNGLTHNGRFFGDALVHLQPEIIDFIENDIDAWERKVSAYAYAQSMSNTEEL